MELGDWLRVDSKAGKPLFDQFRTQVIEGVRDGRVAARQPPADRAGAGRPTWLAVNTVARAYRELETAAIVETRGRFGTFVARLDPADAAMAAAAQAYVEAARGLGLTKADALRYVDAAFDD